MYKLLLILLLPLFSYSQEFNFDEEDREETSGLQSLDNRQEFDKKDPCEPFSECWCDKHPRECEDGHHGHPAAPINQYVYLLFGVVITIGYFKLKRNHGKD